MKDPENPEELRKLIKEANQQKFSPSQLVFAQQATKYVHSKPEPKLKLGAIKGRYKRHKERKARGFKVGFGKGWSAPPVWFRVELNWHDEETKDESNEQVHWVACRKFEGEEYKFYRRYFNREDNGEWEQGHKKSIWHEW
jgi:hypothetical protein